MKWISVKDQMPEKEQDCLFVNMRMDKVFGVEGNELPAQPLICSGFYLHKNIFKSWIDVRDNWKATHWMPLPEPPTQEG